MSFFQIRFYINELNEALPLFLSLLYSVAFIQRWRNFSFIFSKNIKLFVANVCIVGPASIDRLGLVFMKYEKKTFSGRKDRHPQSKQLPAPFFMDISARA